MIPIRLNGVGLNETITSRIVLPALPAPTSRTRRINFNRVNIRIYTNRQARVKPNAAAKKAATPILGNGFLDAK